MIGVFGVGTAHAQPGVDIARADEAEKAEDGESWETVGLGPAMLLIPARPELGRAAIRDVGAGALSVRKVRMLSPHAGWETVAGVVIHDEETLECIWDWYNRGSDDTVREKWVLAGMGWLFLPLAASSAQTGVGALVQSAPEPPFVHGSFGLMFTPMLWRLSQPGMRFDIGSGVYGGVGVMFTRSFGFSARVSYDALLFHQLERNGYGHVWTGVATLDFRPRSKKKKKKLTE